tara:strand:+ start:3074 stop:6820 length:3747 start_codon:yes stop_codon:yes gene_type:complete
MPEIKNNFVKSKMNKDLDERLIPKGEYREAQNVLIAESEDSDVGAIEIMRGNLLRDDYVGSFSAMAGSPEVIGFVRDVKEKKIYYFVTNFTGNDTDDIRNITRAKGAGSSGYSGSSTDDSMIVEYDVQTSTNKVLVRGAWLNFSKNHLITGAQIIDDLLFFTDNYNQPRKINVERARNSSGYYSREEQVAIAKYAPYAPIRLVNKNGVWAESNTATENVIADKTDGNIKSDYLKENFVRFSYRFKYDDGEYSLFAPFTQIVFEPLNNGELHREDDLRNTTSNEPKVPISTQDVLQKTTVDIMRNAINKVILRIPIPNADERSNTDGDFQPDGGGATQDTYANPFYIREIQIVCKEANSRAVKVIKNIKISNEDGSLHNEVEDNLDKYSIKPKNAGTTTYYRQVYKYVYRSEKPFQVLPEDQTTRVFDQAPLQAKALDVVGNRVVFGNFVENYEYPKDESGKKGINYYVSSETKGDIEFTPTFGLHQHHHNAYKHHNLKQRRTYQVGIVFADKYGRQSPVILSSFDPGSSNNQTTDTFHLPADVTDKKAYRTVTTAVGSTTGSSTNVTLTSSNSNIKVGQLVSGTGVDSKTVVSSINNTALVLSDAANLSGVTLTFKDYSWSTNQVAYGEALSIAFEDSTLFSAVSKGIYNSSFGADYNPHGWYSYRIVVKQTEQEYYNVYACHTANSWSNTGTSETTEANSTKKQLVSGHADTGAGGRSWLTLYGDNINKVPRNPTEQDFEREGISGSNEVLYPKILPLDGSGPSRLGSGDQEYIDVISIGTAREQGLFNDEAILGPNPGDLIAKKPRTYNFVFGKDRNPLVAELPNLANEDVDVNSVNVGLSTTDSLDTDTPFGFPGDPNIGIGETPQYGSEGLTVFETKPFESLIDIYYESTTCGLVQDLDDQVAGNTLTGGPSNIAISPTTFDESATVGTTVTTVSATDNTGSSNLSYSLASALQGSSSVFGSFNVNASTGAVTLQGTFRRTDTDDDNIKLQFYVNDPDVGQVTSGIKTLQIQQVQPVVPSSQTASVAVNAGTNHIINGSGYEVKNGSAKESEDHIGITVSHSFTNETTFNNLFTLQLDGNMVKIKTTSNWTQTAGTNFFSSTYTNSDRTMTITVDDNLSANNTNTFDVQIDQIDVSEQGTLDVSQSSTPCDHCYSTVSTFYAVRNGISNTPPSTVSGELRVYAGNKLYTNSSLTTTASDGNYFYENDASTGTNNSYICITVGSPQPAGVVHTVVTTNECEDRDS